MKIGDVQYRRVDLMEGETCCLFQTNKSQFSTRDMAVFLRKYDPADWILHHYVCPKYVHRISHDPVRGNWSYAKWYLETVMANSRTRFQGGKLVVVNPSFRCQISEEKIAKANHSYRTCMIGVVLKSILTAVPISDILGEDPWTL